jgi:hypothetical protein
MIYSAPARIDRTPSYSDLEIANLVHRALAAIQDAGRFGDRIVLCRADLVAAMDPAQVAASETVADGAMFHFTVDPAVGCEEYAPRIRAPKMLHAATGRIGKVGTSRRVA